MTDPQDFDILSAVDEALKEMHTPSADMDGGCKLYEMPVPSKENDGWMVFGEIVPPDWFIEISKNLETASNHLSIEEDFMPKGKVKNMKILLNSANDFKWAKFHLMRPESFMRELNRAVKAEADRRPECSGSAVGYHFSREFQKVFIRARFDITEENKGALGKFLDFLNS